jgi:branched-chain amino acid transport system substrate-binding protein
MPRLTRRAALGGLAAAPLAMPGLLRAQSTSQPVRIGLLSDMSGPYRDVGGPGNKVAAQLAVDDFGGSVLGRPIEIMQADNQDKPDVAGALAREWIDNKGVDVLADGSASSSGLAVQQVAREKKRIYLITGPASSDFTGKQCSPYGIHFAYDTYALAKGTGGTLTKAGGDSWYFITADYAFGYALERDTMAAVKGAGGKVLGAVRAPLATSDFSSYLLQAKASGAKVIGLANAGTDTQNCIKQAAEFGLSQSGTRLATLLMQITDVNSLGQKTCEGLVFTDSFYWDMTPATAAWSKRYMAQMTTPPGLLHAANYCAVNHWLKAVKAAGTTDADTVVAQMKAMPVNDFYNKDVKIREDGRVMHVMYLWQVKPVAESTHQYDFCKLLATIPPEEAWRPLADGGCPLVKA